MFDVAAPTQIPNSNMNQQTQTPIPTNTLWFNPPFGKNVMQDEHRTRRPTTHRQTLSAQ